MQIDLELFERIIRNLPNYIFVKDINFIYTLCNHNFSIMVGDNPIGKSDYDLAWSKKSADIYLEEDKLIIETGQSILDKEVPMTILDKEKILSVCKVPLYDENHEIIGIVGTFTDITDKKKAEKSLILAKEKAELANQAKTEFLENMRHDIRTPLSGIVGCAELIQMKSNNPAKVAEFATDLVDSSNALLEFLNRILESIKVATGEIPLLKQRFDLYKELEQIIKLNKPQANIKNLNLHLDYDKTIPTLLGDPIRIQRIALELVTNALKYTDNGEIIVSTRLVKNENREVIIELSVSDTGMGIPKDKHQEVYTRFTRLIPSYKGIYPGTGLGLSVVKQFIDDLNGEIHIESDVGEGSTFICLIPLQESLLPMVDTNDETEDLIFFN